MFETSDYIYKTLNEKIDLLKNNGILILPFPPGIGKTYNVVRFIKENYKKRKMFFVSNQLKLLPSFEKITKDVTLIEKEDISKEYLEIPSLLEGFRNYIHGINNVHLFEEIDEFKEINSTIVAYDRSKEEDAQEYFFNKFHSLEKEFRSKLKNKIKDEEYLKKYKRFIEKLYPATLLMEKNIIMLTTKKFFLPIDTIFHSTLYLAEEKIENSIIFIDEIDSTKGELLDLISSSNMKNFRIDCISLFRRIYESIFDFNITQTLLFDNIIDFPQETEEYYQKGQIILKRLFEFSEKYQDLFYQIKKPFRRLNNSNETKNFIFKDKRSIVVQNESNTFKEEFFIEYDQEKSTNLIIKENYNTNGKTRLKHIVDNVIYAIKGFMFEILNLARLYNEYQNKYALRNKINIQERISLKHSINSILDRLSLGEENRIFLLETIFNISKTIEVKSMAFEIEGKRDKRKRKYDFYYDGFSFIQLIDYEDCNLQTKIFFNMYNITPEGMLLKLVENYPVIGLSATANFDSCIKNYDLNFLKYKINDKFIEMSNKEIEEFNNLNKTNDYNIKIDLVQDYKVLRCKLMDCFADFKKFEDELSLVIPEEKKHDVYNLLYQFKRFTESDAHSFIFFLSYNLNNHKKIVDFLDKWMKQIDDCGFVIIDKNSFKKTKLNLDNAIFQKRKVFLISCYQTIGVGVNLKYDLPGEAFINKKNLVFLDEKCKEKDIDGCFLSMPTNIIPFYEAGKTMSKDTLVKLLYNMEYLKANDQIDYSKFNVAIKNIFYEKPLSIGKYNGYKDINVGVLMVIIQAIGRICRTNVKNKEVYIGYEAKVGETISKVKKIQKNILLNYECKEFLNSIKESKDDLQDLKNRLKIANIETYRDIRDALKWPFDYKKMIFWKKLREFVLAHPTASEEDFVGNREFQKYYLKFSKPLSCYSVDKYNFTSRIDLYVSEYSNGLLEKRYSISDRDCDLLEIMKNEFFNSYFKRHNYATTFRENEYIMSPQLFHRIYKGALGEAIGKACFSMYGLELKEIEDVKTFELFDFANNNKYLDFKKWSSYFEINEEDQLEKITKKMNTCKTNEAFIINVIKGYYEDSLPEGTQYASDSQNIFTIAWLYDLKEKKVNEIAINSIIGKVKANEAIINK